MAGKKRKSTPKPKAEKRIVTLLKDERTPKILGLSFMLIAIFLFISFISYLFTWKVDQSIFATLDNPWSILFTGNISASNQLGRLGAVVAHQFMYTWFGLTSFFLVLYSFGLGINLFTRKRIFKTKIWMRRIVFAIFWLTTSLSFVGSSSGFPFGGGFGDAISNYLVNFLGAAGTAIFLLFVLAAFLTWTFNINLLGLLKSKKEVDLNVEDEVDLPKDITERENLEYGKEEIGIGEFEPVDNKPLEKQEENKSDELDLEIIVPEEEPQATKPAPEKKVEEELELEITEVKQEKILSEGEIREPYDPKLDLSDYKFPTIDLLEDYGDQNINIDSTEVTKNKDQIIETLKNYSIKIDSIRATIGPTVTLYEIVPAPGVRISKIKNLEDDIALSLAALGIRIIAPIPGKGTIGIEVPNAKKAIVPMRTILSSEKFQNTDMELPVALGKTISNENMITDLAKMPHLLMAGATGQGKSVGLNAMLVSLLYKKHPAELKFVLIDPKKVELNLFNTIEHHFLAKLPGEAEPIITDTKKVVATLNALCIEMDERYDLLKAGNVRNLKEYNAKFKKRRLNPEKGHKFLPYIVLVIDEFADLIMTAGKEVEAPIARLAQLARAIGIHLVIATQRPSVNIITGIIKANFPARIAFKVTSKVDSRTILDASGADQLIGRGDMLLSTGGNLTRIQCAFVDTHEVEKVAEFIGAQRGYSEAFMLPEYAEKEEGSGSGGTLDERDDMFEEAAKLVVAHQQGSTSLIQRRLKLGYNRAGRIMDQLEVVGVVGPNQGSKAREVLFHTEVELEQFLDTLS